MDPKYLLLLAFVFTSCVNHDLDNARGPYFPKVKEIISRNCVQCHSVSGTGRPSGLPLQLDTDDRIVRQAQFIKSTTIDPPTLSNKRMPYGGELTAEEKEIILKWYKAGGTTNVSEINH